MKTNKWLQKKVNSLQGYRIAITGSTGGLGNAIASHIASLGGELILVNRNEAKTNKQIEELQSKYPTLSALWVKCDMESRVSVIAAAKSLIEMEIDVLILNAGVYHIPRKTTIDGWDNLFQINFASPYSMARIMSEIMGERLKIVAVSSIAMKNKKINIEDPQGLKYIKPMQAYGYTKMLLTYGLTLLDTKSVVSIAHPGITYTNIMTNYSKLTNAIIKPIMRILFPNPAMASLGIVAAITLPKSFNKWYSPRVFDIWGKPVVKNLPNYTMSQLSNVLKICEDTYSKYTSI